MFLYILVRPFTVVRLHGQPFPARFKRAVCFQGPHFPSHRSLTTQTESLTPQRLLVLPSCKEPVETCVQSFRQTIGFNLSMTCRPNSHRTIKSINQYGHHQLHLERCPQVPAKRSMCLISCSLAHEYRWLPWARHRAGSFEQRSDESFLIAQLVQFFPDGHLTCCRFFIQNSRSSGDLALIFRSCGLSSRPSRLGRAAPWCVRTI